MSLSPSGSDFLNHTYSFAIDDSSKVGAGRRFSSSMAKRLGFDEIHEARVGIIANELGNNLVKYAKQGQLLIRKIQSDQKTGIEILSIDSGPGLDTDMVLRDGFTTGTTPGTGLGAVRRQASEFDIYSDARGTVILARVYATEEDDAKSLNFDVGAVSIPVKNEIVSGDAWSVRMDADTIEVMVVDGLGHGPMANRAALEAVTVFEADAHLPTDRMMQKLHGRLKSTRGGPFFFLMAPPRARNILGLEIFRLRCNPRLPPNR